ncbi:hypothetical protein BOPS111487_21140 [Bordetella pseudohinzii]
MALFVLDIALAGEHGSEFQAGLRGDVVKDQFLAIGRGGIRGEGQLPRGQRAAGLGLVVRAATDEEVAVLAGEMEGLAAEVQRAAIGEPEAGLVVQLELPIGVAPPGAVAIDEQGRGLAVVAIRFAEGGAAFADQAAAVQDLHIDGAADLGRQAFVQGDAGSAIDDHVCGVAHLGCELKGGMRDNGAALLDHQRARAGLAGGVCAVPADDEFAVVADGDVGTCAADQGRAFLQIEHVQIEVALVLHGQRGGCAVEQDFAGDKRGSWAGDMQRAVVARKINP